MTEVFRLPDFEKVAAVLSGEEPAEIHGLLCGLICAGAAADDDDWRTRIEPGLFRDDDPQILATEAFLNELFAISLSQLNGDDFNFSLLLPDDEVSFSQRASSLSRWCQGFLSGLGLGGMDKSQVLPATVQEFLRDLVAITQLDCELAEADDAEEQSYIELVEYVRMGVLLVNQELHSASKSTVSSQLHCHHGKRY
jgi:uncharacterized protein YgfB (UPF0149 family)